MKRVAVPLLLSLFLLFLTPTLSYTPFQPSSSFLQQYNGVIESLPGFPHHISADLSWKQLSGYIPVHEEASLFYWFIEQHTNASQTQDEQDASSIPIVIWFNGGPGWFLLLIKYFYLILIYFFVVFVFLFLCFVKGFHLFL